MGHIGIRYASLLSVVVTMFVTFVACGTQLYKVPLHEDTDEKLSASSNPDAAAAADPNSATFGLHAPRGWTKIPIHFRVDHRLTASQVVGLKQAMATWETAVGKKLFVYDGQHGDVTGDSYSDLYSSLQDDVNGDYLDDNWGKTSKPDFVLATTIWNNDPEDSSRIVTADIRFNNQYYVFGDSFVDDAIEKREIVDMRSLATHELGHLLGLSHMTPSVDPESIMLPALFIGKGLASRRLSHGDVERIQKIYGYQGKSSIDEILAAIEKQVQEPGIASTTKTAEVAAH